MNVQLPILSINERYDSTLYSTSWMNDMRTPRLWQDYTATVSVPLNGFQICERAWNYLVQSGALEATCLFGGTSTITCCAFPAHRFQRLREVLQL
jgi:hypothetical protein